MHSIAVKLLAALPQTQCTRCGYPDCAAYAQAMASGEAAINQCPPGGDQGIERLAALTGQPTVPMNPAHGAEGPRTMAVIDEAWCIGCTLCIKACPTDAIMGSHKMMHTVIEPYCTGCELCVPVCPVDCISLDNVTGARTGWNAWSQQEADTARDRYALHRTRQQTHRKKPIRKIADASANAVGVPARPEHDPGVTDRKRAVIEAALARARAQRLK